MTSHRQRHDITPRWRVTERNEPVMFHEYNVPIHQLKHEDQVRRLRHIDRVHELDELRGRRFRSRKNRG